MMMILIMLNKLCTVCLQLPPFLVDLLEKAQVSALLPHRQIQVDKHRPRQIQFCIRSRITITTQLYSLLQLYSGCMMFCLLNHYPRTYIPTNVLQSIQMSYIVMQQQTSHPQNYVPTNQQSLIIHQKLALSNKNDSKVLFGLCDFGCLLMRVFQSVCMIVDVTVCTHVLQWPCDFVC